MKHRLRIWIQFLILGSACMHVYCQEALTQDYHILQANSGNLYNLTTLNPPLQKVVSPALINETPPEYQDHPEFGILPFGVPFSGGFELLNKRTATSRYFVKETDTGEIFYVQQSLNDLHYRNDKNQWISIDPRLGKVPDASSLFCSRSSEFPCYLDTASHYASLTLLNGGMFSFDADWNMYYVTSDDDAPTGGTAIQWHFTSMGDDGIAYHDVFPGMDMKVMFDESEITTDFTIKDGSILHPDADFLVLEQQVHINPDWSFRYDTNDGEMTDGRFSGDIILVDAGDRELARMGKSFIYEQYGNPGRNGSTGSYVIHKINDSIWDISLYIDNHWLNAPMRSFPVIIDPVVNGPTATFTAPPYNGSRYWPDSCGYTLLVTTPAMATLTNAYVSFIVQAMNHGCAGTVDCYLADAAAWVRTTCGRNPSDPTYIWGCPVPASCDAPGLLYLTDEPMADLVTCYTPQCAAYTIPFTLELSRLFCNDGSNCLTNCIRLRQFSVYIEGRTVEVTALANGATALVITDCAHQWAWLYAMTPNYGVPNYTYSWSPGGYTSDSIYVNFSPGTTTSYTLTITDACGNTATDPVTINDPCAVLPIGINTFTGYNQEGVNNLVWSTISEHANGVFSIERARDGTDFASIGTLPASGNPNGNTYTFTDNEPFPGVNYYRLKLTEADGTFDYSYIIAIEPGNAGPNSISINNGNPVSDLLDISLHSTQDGAGILRIVDMLGNEVLRRNIQTGSGTTPVILNVGMLPQGTYLLCFTKDAETGTVKFIK